MPLVLRTRSICVRNKDLAAPIVIIRVNKASEASGYDWDLDPPYGGIANDSQ